MVLYNRRILLLSNLYALHRHEQKANNKLCFMFDWKRFLMNQKKITCPHCGSTNVAGILWGMPMFDEELRHELDEGRIVLGGCCVSGADPDWHCNDCGHEFGDRVTAFDRREAQQADKRRGIVFGAAVGDALGVPYEFLKRDTFECTGMSEGGVHGKPAGTFSDDTSLLLATCASLKERGEVDVEDMRRRFCDWLYKGAYTSDGSAFDVGNATATALERGRGCDEERSNGNGSLMRIAPLVFVGASDDEVRAVSAITHAHWISTEACVMFVRILDDLMDGECLEDAIVRNMPGNERFAFLRDLADMPCDAVKSSGFVLDTLGAALWCALHTNSFSDCVLTAVNLGDDSDTTGCVAGALAGAMYGYESIPAEWIDALRGRELIEQCLF